MWLRFSWRKMVELFANSRDLGPVVQSVVSLTSSLRVISLTVLADSIYNILIFFAEKMWVAFALQKLLTFFSKKFQHICVSLDVNFNESLTNDAVSFEQPGQDQTPHSAASDLGLHCLPITFLAVSRSQWVNGSDIFETMKICSRYR